jgi:hypothetical protein
VGLDDLAVLVLHDRRVGAVQDARAAADRERRAVARRVDAVAGGLDADQLDLGVVDERDEDPDRVGAAADARDDALGQPPRLLEHLRDTGRARYVAITDEEALATLRRVAELEGIIPALESSHAVAWVLQADAEPDTLDLICLSGRGDKDLAEVLPKLGIGD